MTQEQIDRMMKGEQVLTDAELGRYRDLALCDDWHERLVGSDIRMILGDLFRARDKLAKAHGDDHRKARKG